MQGVFETAGESGFMDVEMTLNVKCTSDDTMEVTSNDLQLDPNHPEVCPVGKAPVSHNFARCATSGLRACAHIQLHLWENVCILSAPGAAPSYSAHAPDRCSVAKQNVASSAVQRRVWILPIIAKAYM